MAKILIVYQSQTGFTQQFALWLAKSLHCELVDSKFVTATDVRGCTLVLYGGHVFNHQVGGFRRFYRRYQHVLPPQLLVFGTGVLPLAPREQQTLRRHSFAQCAVAPRFYYLQGQPALAPLPLRLRIRLRVQGYRTEDAQCGRQVVRPVVEAVQRVVPDVW